MSDADDLLETVADVLGTSAMTLAAVVDALRSRAGAEAGAGRAVPTEARVAEALRPAWSFVEVSGGVAHLPSLLDGTTWTVAVDAADAADGVVRLHPDLAALGWWFGDVEVLDLLDETDAPAGAARWEVAERDGEERDVLVVPPGSLDAVAGGAASVTVAGRALRLEPCPEVPAPDPAQVEALRGAFGAAADVVAVDMARDEPVELRFVTLERLLSEGLVGDRDTFVATPVAPIVELLSAAGFEERNGTVAEVGFEWAALRSLRVRRRLVIEHGLDEEDARTLFAVLGLTTMFLASGELSNDADERSAAALLAIVCFLKGPLSDAYWAETIGRGMEPGEVGSFAEAVLDANPGTAAPVGVTWLKARCLDLVGETDAARALLDSVVDGTTDHAPALVMLAGFAADRSDAAGALALLERTGVTEHDHHHHDHGGHHHHDHDHHADDEAPSMVAAHRLLDEIGWLARTRPPAMAGRNDRCPCGSGRKYKACHLGHELHPLDERAAWLIGKAERFVRDRHPGRIESLAAAMADPDVSPPMFAQLSRSPFVADVALHEGGGFAEMLAARSGLLPDDERALAEAWLGVDRSIYELERVLGDRILLRDLATGQHLTLANLARADTAGEGRLLVGRPLPMGDGYRAFTGFLPVEAPALEPLRTALDARDPAAVAHALAISLADPGPRHDERRGLPTLR
ncbi:MAG: SEC-C domain-containing protein [Actinomycetota bacterium]|nr:SEC-C domain-containing protein [Actinomycetota bacterium]